MPTKRPKVLIVLDEELIERLDDYRRSTKQIPSRSEAIRTLLDEALSKHEKKAN